jgi:hypothetical protein
MRRKPTPVASPEQKVPVEQPRADSNAEKARRITKCTVCGEDVAPNSVEGLCWVCRRLKISAWRDSDPQVTATE